MVISMYSSRTYAYAKWLLVLFFIVAIWMFTSSPTYIPQTRLYDMPPPDTTGCTWDGSNWVNPLGKVWDGSNWVNP